MEGREAVRMRRTIGGQRTTAVRADSIRLVRMVRTIGGQRTTAVRADSIRLVRMVRTIGGQTWMLDSLKPLWDNDGLRALERHWQVRQRQLAFGTRPDVTPVFAAGRAKGRFQDAVRKTRCPFSGFSRMLAVRSVSDNTRRRVEEYVAGQIAKEGFINPRFREQMEEFTVSCPEIDLSQPMGAIRVRADRLGGG
jgi:hypothetical protein